MIKKQFTFLKDTVAPNIKTPIVFNNETMSIGEVLNKLNELSDENEQLKQELIEFKKWEKYVGDVKREDLDKIFNMSIYEITEAFEYYKKRIKELQG